MDNAYGGNTANPGDAPLPSKPRAPSLRRNLLEREADVDSVALAERLGGVVDGKRREEDDPGHDQHDRPVRREIAFLEVEVNPREQEQEPSDRHNREDRHGADLPLQRARLEDRLRLAHEREDQADEAHHEEHRQEYGQSRRQAADEAEVEAEDDEGEPIEHAE